MIRAILARLRSAESDPTAIPELATLLHEHFGREENELIPRLSKHLPATTGPIAVVLEEHRRILELLGELGAGADEERLGRFDAILKAHMAKEEELLLPFAEEHLGEGGE